MKKSNYSLFLVFLFLIFFMQSAFAEVSFLSPSAGQWCNKQMLIIENIQDGDYYYSVDGSDPETFGFAYDGPVLLDIEGDVTLKVVHFDSSGNKDYGQVDYSVLPNEAFSKDYGTFISQFYNNGYYDYIAGDIIDIPSSLSYSFEKNPTSFIPGTILSIDENLSIERTIPCTVVDNLNNNKWRFVLHISPYNMGIFSKRELPFTISDWNTITFNDDSLIYKIDKEYWGQPTEPIEIDRSVSHMISWQSIDYKLGNIIEYFVLPPKRDVIKKINDDGSITYRVNNALMENQDDDIYSLSILSDNENDSPELFSQLTIDIFYGDKLSGELKLGIYADSVYQGQVVVNYDIDKRPPGIPAINSSAKTFYSRNPVDIDIHSSEGSELYVAVSEPFVIDNDKQIYESENQIFDSVNADYYEKSLENVFNVKLLPIEDKVVYYKVKAYSEKNGLKSNTAEYSVVLNQSSYYYNKDSTTGLAEGTIINPFTNFEQCIEAFKEVRSVSLILTGDLFIEKKYKVPSNIKIINSGEGRIIFGPNGSLEVEGSSIVITDCRLHKIPSFSAQSILPFFKINHGTLELNNCQIAGDFTKNATIVDAVNSIVNIQDSIISVSAESYSSFISTIDSRVSIFNSSITSTGGTSVIISANNGELIVSDNKLKIIGKTGRIAELFGVNSIFENNEFKADLQKKTKAIEPIFANKKTNLIEKGNTQVGF